MTIDELAQWLPKQTYSSIILLTEKKLEKFYHRYIQPHIEENRPVHIFHLPEGEKAKSLKCCQAIWSKLLEHNIDQRALIINLGGGSISDTGGYIAACYKRGIDYINIPTTLLAMIDAAIGGKTAIDIGNVKNAIGAFLLPTAVAIIPEILETLPQQETFSGFGEMIKYALIADKQLWNELKRLPRIDSNSIPFEWIQRCGDIKEEIVKQDFRDLGQRRVLNFGHTIGHAFESYGLAHHTMTHGHAVALGIICESWISWKRHQLTDEELNDICRFILPYYPLPKWKSNTVSELLQYCLNDKKKDGSKTNITLLNHIGEATTNNDVSYEEMEQSLLFIQQFYNE